MRLLISLAVATLLSLTPVIAKPNAQLVRSVEQRLSVWGFGDVEGETLSTAQISALHLKLSSAPPRFGRNAIRFKQELKSILRWPR